MRPLQGEGDPACNPARYPDWESNQRPFGSSGPPHSTELHQPGLGWNFEKQECLRSTNLFYFILFKILFIYFLERVERREKERERKINVQEIHQSVASHVPPTGEPDPQPRHGP